MEIIRFFRRMRNRWHSWRVQRRAAPYLDRAQEIYGAYEKTMNAYDAENKAADPKWEGGYTREQRETLDHMMAAARHELDQAYRPRNRAALRTSR